MKKMEQELKDIEEINSKLFEVCKKYVGTTDNEFRDDVLDIVYMMSKMEGKLQAQININKEKEGK